MSENDHTQVYEIPHVITNPVIGKHKDVLLRGMIFSYLWPLSIADISYEFVLQLEKAENMMFWAEQKQINGYLIDNE